MHCLPTSLSIDRNHNRLYFIHDVEMNLKNSTKLLTNSNCIFTCYTLQTFLFTLQPEAISAYTADCPVVYSDDSDPQYAPESKEIHALAYAIRALAGCSQSKTTNPFFTRQVYSLTFIHKLPLMKLNIWFMIK